MPQFDTDNTDLAALVKDWRGTLPASRAAQLLGIPARTLEGIEQGRGFRYYRTLILAMRALSLEKTTIPSFASDDGTDIGLGDTK